MTRRVHRPDCDRFLAGTCRCRGKVLTEPECGPLAARLIEARDEDRARLEAAG